MSNANTSQLAVPLLEERDGDLLVRLADGSQGWQVPGYFAGVDADLASDMLAHLNVHTVLERHPRSDGELWGLGTDGPDVMVGGDFDVSIAAGDGKDVVITGNGDDYLGGDDGDDWLYGQGGNDEIKGGNGDDHLFGGAGSDLLGGGRGDDRLFGGAGDDRLYGAAGNDRLKGGSGNDLYYFGKGDGHDIIFNHDAAGDDRVQFRAGIAPGQLWFRRAGDSLEVSLLETGDTLRLNWWFDGDEHRVDRFQLSNDGFHPNGQHLDKHNVDALVQAMAGLAMPPIGTTALPQDYRQVLDPVLAASWT
ncbi:calcium-binding protein [Herbaspirillum sp. YR522]|uniref:calcium-binding protein n=1 Tax=Herbaspirillum sp. YR522 TaxID=1144342 RepID=UPI00026FC45A|nr:calcium-binding protein [Herbaspirillum sp. YR522]EJN09579.1 putative calcium-binding protein [Herbaspirillum sp. YR522]